MDHARKLKFSSYVHLPSIKKHISISSHVSDFVQYRRGLYFRAWTLYLRFGTHVRMLILSTYVLLACIKAIYRYCHAWVI